MLPFFILHEITSYPLLCGLFYQFGQNDIKQLLIQSELPGRDAILLWWSDSCLHSNSVFSFKFIHKTDVCLWKSNIHLNRNQFHRLLWWSVLKIRDPLAHIEMFITKGSPIENNRKLSNLYIWWHPCYEIIIADICIFISGTEQNLYMYYHI